MNKILTVIALAAALVVGAKFFLEYRYKKELDQVLKGASLVADVRYDDLSVGFDGTVELSDLRITPNGAFDTFKVRSIKLSGLNLMFHFNGKSQLQNGEFPKFVRFNLDQFSFPASLYEEQALKSECKSFNGTLLYSSAGFDQVVVNASMEFDLADPFAARVDFSGSDQVSRTSFSVDFNARQMSPTALAGGAIPVQSMRYDYYLDQEAAKAMVEHCAKKFEITPEVFLNKVVTSQKYMTNSFGLNLGQAASKAMAGFLQGDKEIVVRSTPSERLKNASFATSSSAAQIVRMLNLNVSLDGSTVPISTFQSNSSSDIALAEEGEEPEEQGGYKRRDLDELLSSPDGTIQERVRPNYSRKRKDNYERATLSRVRDYIDQDVRVSRTKDRSAIEGRLLGSKDNILSVEIFRYGGVMTYTIPYKDVARIDVKKTR